SGKTKARKMATASKNWDDHAALYNDVFHRSTIQYARTALEIANFDPTKSKSFLDVACGPGGLSLMAYETGAFSKIHATDFSSEMINNVKISPAMKKVFEDPHVTFTTDVVDGQTLSGIESSSFDVVGSNFGIFLFQDRIAAWKSAWRVMKPGGTLIATSWDEDSALMHLLKPVLTKLNLPPPSPNSTRSFVGFEKEVRDCGFNDVKIFQITHPFYFKTAKDFVESTIDNAVFGSIMKQVADPERELLQAVTELKDIDESVDVKTLPEWNKPVLYHSKANILFAQKHL
ncbi:hypothetical protein HK096_009680, partial [Nowakowskiella sp. JEL0078]